MKKWADRRETVEDERNGGEFVNSFNDWKSAFNFFKGFFLTIKRGIAIYRNRAVVKLRSCNLWFFRPSRYPQNVSRSAALSRFVVVSFGPPSRVIFVGVGNGFGAIFARTCTALFESVTSIITTVKEFNRLRSSITNNDKLMKGTTRRIALVIQAVEKTWTFLTRKLLTLIWKKIS